MADLGSPRGFRFALDPEKGGGLNAFNVKTGKLVWNPRAAPCPASKKNCSPAQSAAVTVIPGVVFPVLSMATCARTPPDPAMSFGNRHSSDFRDFERRGRTRWFDGRWGAAVVKWVGVREFRIQSVGRHARQRASGLFSRWQVALIDAWTFSTSIVLTHQRAPTTPGCMRTGFSLLMQVAQVPAPRRAVSGKSVVWALHREAGISVS